MPTQRTQGATFTVRGERAETAWRTNRAVVFVVMRAEHMALESGIIVETAPRALVAFALSGERIEPTVWAYHAV